MELKGIVPDYGEENFKENFAHFILDLQSANGDITEITNSNLWNHSDKEEETGPESYFDVIGARETFSKEVIQEAAEILKSGNFLDYVVDTISEVVRAQKDKILLVFLISLSSFLKKSLAGVGLAGAGKGKSMVNDHVYQ